VSVSPSRGLRGTRGQAAIGLLVSVVIILIVLLVGLGMWKANLGPGQSTPARVESKARGVQCQQLLAQCRMMPLMNDPESTTIRSIKDFEGGGVELRCPVSGLRYRFDPSRGAADPTRSLHCPYPKHTGF